MLNIAEFSRQYAVRRLDASDVDEIRALCAENRLYYRYCRAQPTREQILNDLSITPPGIGAEDKYYVGFYQTDTLVAVMDLIDGFPERGIAFIGFFMMNAALQGRGVGSAIIRGLADALKAQGKTAMQLGIDKGNPQSTHFWKKNGFSVLREVPQDGRTILLARMQL